MEETILNQGTVGDVHWKVVFDNDPSSPREWDNGAVMVCEHRRYNLGDENGRDLAIEAVRESRDYRPSWEEYDNPNMLDLSEPGDLWKAIQRCSDILAAPLYLYDHSGISIAMAKGGNPFHCQCMVGFTFITKAKVLENFMKPEGSRLSAALKAKAFALMEAETSTYDDYLTGQVFGYVVYTADEDGDELDQLDSCWGSYGQEYCESEAKSMAEYHAKEERRIATEATALHI
jgi:hypothetical protein